MKDNLPTFIKWAGGKMQLIDQYKPYFPKKINSYFEPFLGSGSVFFFVKERISPTKVVLSDSNNELIKTFIAVRDNPEELIKSLKKRKALHSKEYFYKVRKEKTKELSDLEIASRLIYLNKTCFNGLYRVNSKGDFNVPFGDYKTPAIVDEEKIRKASKLLQNTEVETRQFEEVLKFADKMDFVYFDPPYFPLSKTSSFTSYTNGSFLEKEQVKLSKVFKELDKRGCLLMLSNSDHPFIGKLYKNFNIHIVKARRNISCIGTKRGKINEIVVTNYKTDNINSFITK